MYYTPTGQFLLDVRYSRSTTPLVVCTNFPVWDPQIKIYFLLRPGTQWISPLLAMQSQCEQVGLCGENVGVQSMCNNQYTCSDGVSNSQQTCESIGTCNDFNGCVFDWDPVDFRCRIGFIWTPLGCLSINIDNSLDCTGQGGYVQ